MRKTIVWLGLTASLISAEFLVPTAANPPTVGVMVPVTWNTYLLKNPLNLYLIPSEANDISKSVLQIAANVGNTGNFAWTPDTSIAPEAGYKIFLADASNITFTSERFIINGVSPSSGSGSSSAESTVWTTNTRVVMTTERITMTRPPKDATTSSTSVVETTASTTSSSSSTTLSSVDAAALFAPKVTATSTIASNTSTSAVSFVTSVSPFKSSTPVAQGFTLPLNYSVIAPTRSTKSLVQVTYNLPAPTDVVLFNMSIVTPNAAAVTTSSSVSTGQNSQFTGGATSLDSKSVTLLSSMTALISIMLFV